MRHTPIVISLLLLAALGACKEEPEKQIGDGPADLVLEIADLRHEFVDGRHKYHHVRRYIETSGTGVNLEVGKVCVENGKACISARVQYRIDAKSRLVQPNHHVATRLDKDRITIEYWGRDDAGNDVRVERVLRVDGERVSVE